MESGVRKVHHSYIWLGGLKALLATIVAVALSIAGSLAHIAASLVEDGRISLPFAVALAIGGLAVLCLLFTIVFGLGFWASWRHLGYELGSKEFSFYKGVFSKKRLHVPYQRIQSVDIRASLLQRLAGVCSVEVDTAGGFGNKAIVVPYVTKSDAQKLRHELFARKQALLVSCSFAAARQDAAADLEGGRASEYAERPRAVSPSNVLDDLNGAFSETCGLFDDDSFAETTPPSFEIGLSNRELVLSGISDARNIAAGIALGFAGAAAFILGFEPASDALAAWLEHLAGPSQLESAALAAVVAKVAARLFPMLVLSFTASLLAIAAFSAIASVLSYGAFKVRRRGSRIEVERGLLQHQTQGIDIDRVQFLRIEHGWIRRKLGYCKVYLGRIDSAAKGDKAAESSPALSGKGMVIHPFAKTSDLPELLAGIVPEFSFVAEAECAPPARAHRRALLRGALWRNGGFWLLAIGLAAAAAALVAGKLALPRYWDAICGFLTALWPVALLLVAIMAVGAVRARKWHAGSSLSYGCGFVSVVNEGFTREEVLIPRKKTQYTCLRANPFQLAAHLRCVLVTTAAGSTQTTELIWDIDEQQADDFLDWVRPREALVKSASPGRV